MNFVCVLIIFSAVNYEAANAHWSHNQVYVKEDQCALPPLMTSVHIQGFSGGFNHQGYEVGTLLTVHCAEGFVWQDNKTGVKSIQCSVNEKGEYVWTEPPTCKPVCYITDVPATSHLNLEGTTFEGQVNGADFVEAIEIQGIGGLDFPNIEFNIIAVDHLSKICGDTHWDAAIAIMHYTPRPVCYQFHTDTANYTESKSRCQSPLGGMFPGKLMKADHLERNRHVNNIIKKLYPSAITAVWVGGEQSSKDGKWYWGGEGGEPIPPEDINRSKDPFWWIKNGDSNDPYCMALPWGSALSDPETVGKLHSESCKRKNYRVCQYEASSIPKMSKQNQPDYDPNVLRYTEGSGLVAQGGNFPSEQGTFDRYAKQQSSIAMEEPLWRKDGKSGSVLQQGKNVPKQPREFPFVYDPENSETGAGMIQRRKNFLRNQGQGLLGPYSEGSGLVQQEENFPRQQGALDTQQPSLAMEEQEPLWQTPESSGYNPRRGENGQKKSGGERLLAARPRGRGPPGRKGPVEFTATSSWNGPRF